MNQSKIKILKVNDITAIFLSEQSWDCLKFSQDPQVVFFLNDAVFAKKRLSELEQVLRSSFRAYYYSDYLKVCYDRYEIYYEGKRFWRSGVHAVRLQKIFLPSVKFLMPPFIFRSQSSWGLKGDVRELLHQKKILCELSEKAFIKKFLE